jgi:hypothetical protein
MTYDEIVFQQKVTYLTRLLNVYVKFMKYYSAVEISIKDKTIEVKYSGAKNGARFQFKCIEFPKNHLGKRIINYKSKVKKEFSERQNNPNWR